MRLIPIDATKNMVQANTQVPTVGIMGWYIAEGVNPSLIDESDIAKTRYVEDGAMVRGFSIQGRVYNESGTQDSNSTVILLRKNEGGVLPDPTLAMLNSIGAQTWKNKIFHFEQAITGSQVSGWPMGLPSIRIPKRFHKMNLGDRWELWVGNNTANNVRFCGTAIYKWYR